MIELTTLPEWKNLYEKFKEYDYNSIISYTTLNKTLAEGDVKTDKRHIFERFKKEMLREENKALRM